MLNLVSVSKGRTSSSVSDYSQSPTKGRCAISTEIFDLMGLDSNDKAPKISMFLSEDATGMNDRIFITKGFGENQIALAAVTNEITGKAASYAFSNASVWDMFIQYAPADAPKNVITKPIGNTALISKGLVSGDSGLYKGQASVTPVMLPDGTQYTLEFEGVAYPVFQVTDFIFSEHAKRTIGSKTEKKGITSIADEVAPAFNEEAIENEDEKNEDENDSLQMVD